MKLEDITIEILSREIIKPASPTPSSLTYRELSFFDQMAPPIHIPVIYFYHPPTHHHHHHHHQSKSEKVNSIKSSLAQTLTRFNHLAGTMFERFYVDCNDMGVEFFEANLNCNLSLLLDNPTVNVLHRLLPPLMGGRTDYQNPEFLLVIQFIHFSCGGAAVVVCLSHKLPDGASIATFVNSWAAASRRDNVDVDHVESVTMIEPNFDAVKLFPSIKIPGVKGSDNILPSKQKVMTKRFVFDKSDVDALKRLATNNNNGSVVNAAPSRVVAVSVFIWLRLIALARLKKVKTKMFRAIYPVDLRQRMDPPLLKNSFGNILWFIVANSPVEIEEDLQVLADKVRTEIQEFKIDFVGKVENDDDDDENEDISFSSMEEATWSFSSWCRFPFYEADFGWGKPTWVCSPMSYFTNVVVLMPTSDGDGIEAWVHLKEQDMAMFDKLLSPF